MVIILLYIALIVTLSYLGIKLPKFKIVLDKPLSPKPALKEKVDIPQTKESHGAIITRPSAKRLKLLNDPEKKASHDAFMGTLDNEPVLRAAREAADPTKKGYVA